MSASINKVILIGNLGEDVKVHQFDDNNKIAKFSLATNESFMSKEKNEKVNHTDWHNIVIKNFKLVDVAEKYLSKGDKIYVEGKLRTRKWEDNGQTKYMTEIIVDTLKFLSIKKTQDSYIDEKDDFSF